MLTLNPINTQTNINFASSKNNLLGRRMLEKYAKCEAPLRDFLVEINTDKDYSMVQKWRLHTLFIVSAVAVVAGLCIGRFNSKKIADRKVEVKETEALKEREKDLDEKYKAGTLLFEEYVNRLNEIKSDYERLETETAQKLDNVVQARINHSDAKSTYSINPETGKYKYDLSVDNKTKTVKINVENGTKNADNIIPQQAGIE